MNPKAQTLHFEKFKLPENATIHAIMKTLLYINTIKDGYRFGMISGSKSSLQALANPTNSSVKINSIK